MEIMNILLRDQSCVELRLVEGEAVHRIRLEIANELKTNSALDLDRTGDNRLDFLGKCASLVGTPDELTIVSQDRIMRTTSSNVS
jgi:hypothetical protein